MQVSVFLFTAALVSFWTGCQKAPRFELPPDLGRGLKPADSLRAILTWLSTQKSYEAETLRFHRLLTCEWHVVSLRGMTLIRACPKCKSEHFIKNGKLHARQRYECKACGYNFTLSKLGKSKPPEVRRMALQLYLEGLSLRGIERLLKISHVTVLKWVRQWGKAIERLRREAEPKEVRQVEIDELCSYIGEKKAKVGMGGCG